MSGSETLRVLIADDEPRARQFLQRLLSEHDDLEVVAVARNGAEALAQIERTKPAVAFLDIQMPDLSGLDVARMLRGDDAPIVVFVTAHDEHAVQAFELAALDYVLKPLGRERLAATLQRVRGEVAQGSRRSGQAAALREALSSEGLRREPLQRLPVRHRREVRLLDLAEVPMVFSRDRLVLANHDGKEYLVDDTLQELEDRLPPGMFVRVHRGALVNLSWVQSFGSEGGVLVLHLKDGSRVEASERRAAEVRRRLR